MTKKDYELIAKVLHDLQQAHYRTWNSGGAEDVTTCAYHQLRATGLAIQHLAETFAKDNPRFNASIFYKACSSFITD